MPIPEENVPMVPARAPDPYPLPANEARYLTAQARCMIRPGTMVVPVREVQTGEGGWGAMWVPPMTRLVGEECVVVRDVGQHGLRIRHALHGEWCFPFFVLSRARRTGLPRDHQQYMMAQECCGLDVGDRVRIESRAPSQQYGWENSWLPEMDAYVGREYAVVSVGQGGIELADAYQFPFFVLSKVPAALRPEGAPEPELADDDAVLPGHASRGDYVVAIETHNRLIQGEFYRVMRYCEGGAGEERSSYDLEPTNGDRQLSVYVRRTRRATPREVSALLRRLREGAKPAPANEAAEAKPAEDLYPLFQLGVWVIGKPGPGVVVAAPFRTWAHRIWLRPSRTTLKLQGCTTTFPCVAFLLATPAQIDAAIQRGEGAPANYPRRGETAAENPFPMIDELGNAGAAWVFDGWRVLHPNEIIMAGDRVGGIETYPERGRDITPDGSYCGKTARAANQCGSSTAIYRRCVTWTQITDPTETARTGDVIVFRGMGGAEMAEARSRADVLPAGERLKVLKSTVSLTFPASMLVPALAVYMVKYPDCTVWRRVAVPYTRPKSKGNQRYAEPLPLP